MQFTDSDSFDIVENPQKRQQFIARFESLAPQYEQLKREFDSHLTAFTQAGTLPRELQTAQAYTRRTQHYLENAIAVGKDMRDQHTQISKWFDNAQLKTRATTVATALIAGALMLACTSTGILAAVAVAAGAAVLGHAASEKLWIDPVRNAFSLYKQTWSATVTAMHNEGKTLEHENQKALETLEEKLKHSVAAQTPLQKKSHLETLLAEKEATPKHSR